MALDYIGDRKITIGLAVAVIGAFVALQQWAQVEFIPRAQAEQSMKALSSKIDANNKLISDHVSVYEKNENRKAIGVIKDQQYALKQYVATNGSTPMTSRREEELGREMSDLLDIKACHERGGENCG